MAQRPPAIQYSCHAMIQKQKNPELKEQNGILVCYVDIHCK